MVKEVIILKEIKEIIWVPPPTNEHSPTTVSAVWLGYL